MFCQFDDFKRSALGSIPPNALLLDLFALNYVTFIRLCNSQYHRPLLPSNTRDIPPKCAFTPMLSPTLTISPRPGVDLPADGRVQIAGAGAQGGRAEDSRQDEGALDDCRRTGMNE